MTQLTAQQIDTLAKFAGWGDPIECFNKYGSYKMWMKQGKKLGDHQIEIYLLNAKTLIEMRLKLMEIWRIRGLTPDHVFAFALWNIDQLILNAKYTEAAIKASEIIQKLEA
jgi:hypothetical protein